MGLVKTAELLLNEGNGLGSLVARALAGASELVRQLCLRAGDRIFDLVGQRHQLRSVEHLGDEVGSSLHIHVK